MWMICLMSLMTMIMMNCLMMTRKWRSLNRKQGLLHQNIRVIRLLLRHQLHLHWPHSFICKLWHRKKKSISWYSNRLNPKKKRKRKIWRRGSMIMDSRLLMNLMRKILSSLLLTRKIQKHQRHNYWSLHLHREIHHMTRNKTHSFQINSPRQVTLRLQKMILRVKSRFSSSNSSTWTSWMWWRRTRRWMKSGRIRSWTTLPSYSHLTTSSTMSRKNCLTIMTLEISPRNFISKRTISSVALFLQFIVSRTTYSWGTQVE